LPPEANQFDFNDLNDDKSSWMKHIYSTELLTGTISGVLSGLLYSKRKNGSLKTKDIKNMTNQYSKKKNLLSRVTLDVPQAEQTVKEHNK
jgi:hypothetical protein